MAYHSFREIELVPIQCKYYHCYNSKRIINKRKMMHYEVDLITKGTAKLTIDQTPYLFPEGSICFRKPGQINRQDLSSPYECYAFYFYTEDNRGINFLEKIPNYLPAERCGEIKETMLQLYNHYFYDSAYHRLSFRAYSLHLAAQLYHASVTEEEQLKTNDLYHPAIQKAIVYIQTNLKSSLKIDDIAKTVGISPKYFHKIFKSCIGKTPNSFIMEERMKLAKEQLLSTDLSVGDIAQNCGFTSHTYFTRVFKTFFHQTPQEFRNNNLG